MLLQRHYEVLSNDKYIASLLEDQHGEQDNHDYHTEEEEDEKPRGARTNTSAAAAGGGSPSAARRKTPIKPRRRYAPFAIELGPYSLETFVCISRRPHRPLILQQLLWMGLAPLLGGRDDAADAANRITR